MPCLNAHRISGHDDMVALGHQVLGWFLMQQIASGPVSDCCSYSTTLFTFASLQGWRHGLQTGTAASHTTLHICREQETVERVGEKARRKITRENTESCIKFEFPKKKNKFSHKYRPCNSQATLILKGFPGSSAGKESTYNAGNLGLIPGLGRSLGEGNGYPL